MHGLLYGYIPFGTAFGFWPGFGGAVYAGLYGFCCWFHVPVVVAGLDKPLLLAPIYDMHGRTNQIKRNEVSLFMWMTAAQAWVRWSASRTTFATAS